MRGLQSELQQLRSHFEESLSSREISEKRLNEQIREVSLHRHEAQQEVRPMVPNQSADRIINSFVLFLAWTKKRVLARKGNILRLGRPIYLHWKEGTDPEGSRRPVGAQFRPIRTSTVEKHLPLHTVDAGFAKLLLNWPRMPLVSLINTIYVYVSEHGNMSY